MKRMMGLCLGLGVLVGLPVVAQPGGLTLLERVRLIEQALAEGRLELPFPFQAEEFLEEARLSGNPNLDVRARTAVGLYRAYAQRLSGPRDPAGLNEAWQRASRRMREEGQAALRTLASRFSLAVFGASLAVAAGGMVLGDQFWKQMVTAPPGSAQQQDAYARMAIADSVALMGSFTALSGALFFTLVEVTR